MNAIGMFNVAISAINAFNVVITFNYAHFHLPFSSFVAVSGL